MNLKIISLILIASSLPNLGYSTFIVFYIGEVLDALENSEYADNTIVILWSDHGYR